jgi:8-hydroxy-5-deazaflavin:NADPH oxidoreductase
MMEKFGVLGSGVVAQTLAKGLKTHGYDVRIASRGGDKLKDFASHSGIPEGTFENVARWSDVVVLAVKGTAAESAIGIAGASNLAGKVVIDTTNPIADEPPVDGVLKFFTGPNDSLLERLQKASPDVRFVKAFNSVGNAYMVNPSLPGGPPTMFYCGNDVEAKKIVVRVLQAFGWDAADMGGAAAARAIEPLCQLWCIPGLREGRWTHAFKLLRQ